MTDDRFQAPRKGAAKALWDCPADASWDEVRERLGDQEDEHAGRE